MLGEIEVIIQKTANESASPGEVMAISVVEGKGASLLGRYLMAALGFTIHSVLNGIWGSQELERLLGEYVLVRNEANVEARRCLFYWMNK